MILVMLLGNRWVHWPSLDSWWIGSRLENLKLPPPAALRNTQLSCWPLCAKLLSMSPHRPSPQKKSSRGQMLFEVFRMFFHGFSGCFNTKVRFHIAQRPNASSHCMKHRWKPGTTRVPPSCWRHFGEFTKDHIKETKEFNQCRIYKYKNMHYINGQWFYMSWIHGMSCDMSPLPSCPASSEHLAHAHLLQLLVLEPL